MTRGANGELYSLGGGISRESIRQFLREAGPAVAVPRELDATGSVEDIPYGLRVVPGLEILIGANTSGSPRCWHSKQLFHELNKDGVCPYFSEERAVEVTASVASYFLSSFEIAGVGVPQVAKDAVKVGGVADVHRFRCPELGGVSVVGSVRHGIYLGRLKLGEQLVDDRFLAARDVVLAFLTVPHEYNPLRPLSNGRLLMFS